MEAPRPNIFISATTADLGPTRTLIADAMLEMGGTPVEHEDRLLVPSGKSAADAIRARLSRCQIVIHLVGRCYGEEEPARREIHSYAVGRRSNVQFEYDLALDLGLETYVFICGENFPYTPHDPEPEELRRYQDEHRQRLVGRDRLSVVVQTEAELRDLLARLEERVRFHSEEIRRQKGARLRMAGIVLSGLAALGILIAFGVWTVKGRPPRPWVRGTPAPQPHLPILDFAEIPAKIKDLEKLNRSNRAVIEQVMANNQTFAQPGQKVQPVLDVSGPQSKAAAQLGLTVEELRRRLTAAGTNAADRLKLAEQLGQDPTAAGPARVARREALDDLGDVAYASGHYGEAFAHYRRAAALFDETKEPKAWDECHHRMAGLLHRQGAYAEAVEVYRQVLARREHALSPEDPALAASLGDLARALRQTGGIAEAESLSRRALALTEKTAGGDPVDTGLALTSLASILWQAKQPAEAEALFGRALAIFAKVYGPDPSAVALGLNNLAVGLHDTQRTAEAELLYWRALAIYEQRPRPDHLAVATELNNLAGLLAATNRPMEAETLYRRSLWTLAEYQRQKGHPPANLEIAQKNYALFLRQQKIPEKEIIRQVNSALEGVDVDKPGVETAQALTQPKRGGSSFGEPNQLVDPAERSGTRKTTPKAKPTITPKPLAKSKPTGTPAPIFTPAPAATPEPAITQAEAKAAPLAPPEPVTPAPKPVSTPAPAVPPMPVIKTETEPASAREPAPIVTPKPETKPSLEEESAPKPTPVAPPEPVGRTSKVANPSASEPGEFVEPAVLVQPAAAASTPKPQSSPKPTGKPKPGSTAKATLTPKPAGTPKAASTPTPGPLGKLGSLFKPRSTPKPKSTPKPEGTPKTKG